MANIKSTGKTINNLIAILSFIIVTMIYFHPLIEGKALNQSDITQVKGMAKELQDFRNNADKEVIWTNSMFGGMPGYMITVIYPYNLVRYIHYYLRAIFHPAAMLFLYLLGFYILLKSLKIKHWLTIAGAIAFGLSSYFLIIIKAGHTSKAYAIGYLAIVFAGMLLAYRNKPLGGSLLFALGLSLNLHVNHLQITYYGFLMAIVYVIVKAIYAIREGEVPGFLKSSVYLLAGAIIAVGMNSSRLYTTWEYSKETIRGPSELTEHEANQTSGLDKDYVVQWSQGINETFTLLIPGFMGSSTSTNPDTDSESYELLRQNNVQNPRNILNQIILYWGDKPATEGPYYFGAIVVFLFVLGLFVVKGPIKWWLLIVAILSILMAWGRHFMGFTSFLLDYLPLYNKFRAPEMTLVMAAFAFPLLGFLGLNQVLAGKTDKKEFLKSFKWALGITGGIALLFFAVPGMAGSFTSQFDQYYPDWLLPGIYADRKEMLRNDAFRSLVFILLGAGTIYLWYLKKIKTNLAIVAIGVLILIDLWAVDKRFLNNEDFVPKRQAENPFPLTPADKEILKDEDLYYRVLPLQNPWQDARASYYHKNVGGYHAAKLRRYQELITYHLQPELQQMVQRLQSGVTSMDSVFRSLEAINMLNTKYIIYDLNAMPLYNPLALGNAWFVDNYNLVENADEEIDAMNSFDPQHTAIVDNRFAEYLTGKNFNKDENGFINLTEYEPNYLKYEFKADSEQLAVFSDIYYDKGWNAYIDGEKVPHFRVNYVLRGMVIPAGEHLVEFKFEPKSYYVGNRVSFASSFLFILLLAGYGFLQFRNYKNSNGNVPSEEA